LRERFFSVELLFVESPIKQIIPTYHDLEKRLAAGPVITVPTITMKGDANRAPHPDPGSYVKNSRASIRTG
jgi:hypothetical protein